MFFKVAKSRKDGQKIRLKGQNIGNVHTLTLKYAYFLGLILVEFLEFLVLKFFACMGVNICGCIVVGVSKPFLSGFYIYVAFYTSCSKGMA